MAEPADEPRIGELLERYGVSRRAFIKYCTAMASVLAMPPLAGRAMAEQLLAKRRPSVIWLSFQQCTGCTESFIRPFSPTPEELMFNVISLDYNETLQAAAGEAAEKAIQDAMAKAPGEYVIIAEGSVPDGNNGFSTVAGRSSLEILRAALPQCAAVVAVGTCATYGGIPYADPNPTGAYGVGDLMKRGLLPRKPLVNVSGCPPIPVVITGTLFHYYTQGRLPELDQLGRPLIFYGNSIHDRCYRRPFYDEGKFAKSFDDEGARNGWCLFELGCKGPTTYNACATLKWNEGTSFPIESGHPCLGCSEPNFWDNSSFYNPIAAPRWGKAGEIRPSDAAKLAGGAAAAGAAIGAGSVLLARHRQKKRIDEPKTED